MTGAVVGSSAPTTVNGETLSIADVIAVATGTSACYDAAAVERIVQGRRVMDDAVAARQTVYGVNTGIGDLGQHAVNSHQIGKLQLNILRSHAAGVGPAVPTSVVRALLVLRANTFAKGLSGVRLETAEAVLALLNAGVTPVVPSKGSVGASGDLAPLSHAALVLVGEGQAEYGGEIMLGSEALRRAGLAPLTLQAKEALALNNGTQYTTAAACLALQSLEGLLSAAVCAAALTLEAMRGLSDSFDARVHEARAHPGARAVSAEIVRLTSGSAEMCGSQDVSDDTRGPQDPYCLRAIPPVLGSVLDALDHLRRVLSIEINSATDDPLFFAADRGGIKYCCNFHAQPVAMALDFLKIAATTLGNMAERRIAAMTDPHHSHGLPPYLVHPDAQIGLSTGFMVWQCTAASLASENKVLAHPASVDTIPTAAGFEDFVSMGPSAALQLQDIISNCFQIVAIELALGAQAVDIRGSREQLGVGSQGVYTAVREWTSTVVEDRPLAAELEALASALRHGSFPRLTELGDLG